MSIDFEDARDPTPWARLKGVLGSIQEDPSIGFRKVRDQVAMRWRELHSLAQDPSTPTVDAIRAAKAFDPGEYIHVFPLEFKDWRRDVYLEFLGRLRAWEKAESGAPRENLRLFAEYLRVLAIHYELAGEHIDRAAVMDDVFGSITKLMKAAERLPEIAAFSTACTDAMDRSIGRYQDMVKRYQSENRGNSRKVMIFIGAASLALMAVVALALWLPMNVMETATRELHVVVQKGIEGQKSLVNETAEGLRRLEDKVALLGLKGDRITKVEKAVDQIGRDVTEQRQRLQSLDLRLSGTQQTIASLDGAIGEISTDVGRLTESGEQSARQVAEMHEQMDSRSGEWEARWEKQSAENSRRMEKQGERFDDIGQQLGQWSSKWTASSKDTTAAIARMQEDFSRLNRTVGDEPWRGGQVEPWPADSDEPYVAPPTKPDIAPEMPPKVRATPQLAPAGTTLISRISEMEDMYRQLASKVNEKDVAIEKLQGVLTENESQNKRHAEERAKLYGQIIESIQRRSPRDE